MLDLFSQSRTEDDLFADEFELPARLPRKEDRSLTGGLSKVKLSEEELSRKLERMRILNASKMQKHLLQEADQAAFLERDLSLARERGAREERERANRLEMEEERARNREHKIKCTARREWDLGKETTFPTRNSRAT